MMASPDQAAVDNTDHTSLISSSTDDVTAQGNPEAMDLSIRKNGDTGDAVKVEMIPTAYDVKINDLVIDTTVEGPDDDDNHEITITVGASSPQTDENTEQSQHGVKRKQQPEEIDSCVDGGYAIASSPKTQKIRLIQENGDTFIVSNGNECVDVKTVSEVATTNQVNTFNSLKTPTVSISASTASKLVVTTTGDVTHVMQAPLLGSPLFSSNGKPMRPFKVYTQNRDLLAGIGLDKNAIAAALSGRPLLVPVMQGSAALTSATVLSPLTSPLMPTTISSGLPPTTVSRIGSTAENTPLVISAAASTVTATPSAMRLMTLATEADKILKKKTLGTTATSEQTTRQVPVVIATSETSGEPATLGRLQDDGTIQVTLHPQQITLTSKQAKSKKNKNQQNLPETMKTTNYWERRRKNNEAAKRSRDARRAKEDQVAIRAAMLEHENTRLKIENAALKEEVMQLRAERYEEKKEEVKQLRAERYEMKNDASS